MENMYSWPKTEVGRKVLEIIKELPISSYSHGIDHHLRALRNAHKLHAVYGGDLEVIEASVLLHDVAKLLDAKIKNHAVVSAKIAEKILNSMGFPAEKIKKVVVAIEHHDDLPFPCEDLPLEAKIVHDADWLDGFGALGILRISMVAGEKGREIEVILKKIAVEMKKRVQNLCFDESRRYAIKKWTFVEAFLEELEQELNQEPL